jgi:hypothetical protein
MTKHRATPSQALADGEPCPHCLGGVLEHHQHRFSADRGPNLPDADWLACDECDFATDPE